MSDTPDKAGKLTEKSDTKGIEVKLCDPGWFDKRDKFKIANAPPRTTDLEFSGLDLNFAARVLYAEASGSGQLKDKAERMKEKAAILNVKHFRLNRKGFPNNHKAKTFTEVCMAPNQFESVFGTTPKFKNSDVDKYDQLKKSECQDLAECIEAIKDFLTKGPDKEMIFDNFRGGKLGQGKVIGLSRFWLSNDAKVMYEKEE